MPRAPIPPAMPEAAGGAALRRLDLVSLRLFEAVAETGSLSGACARLHLALAAGSRRLSDLEAALGVKLAERDRRGMRLTPAGEAALARWRLASDGLRRMVLETRDAAAGVRGQLRLAASSSVVVQFLPAALSAFLPLHPHLRLDLRETTSRDAAAALGDGSVDLALMDLLHVPAGCEHRPWREDRLVAVLPRGHALLADAPKRLPFAALLGHDLVGLDPGTALHAALRAAAEAAGQELRLRIQVYSFEAVALLAGAGLGLAVLPDGAVRGRAAALGLVPVPLSDSWARRRHVLAARRFDALPEAARLFAAHLRARASLRAPRRLASPDVR